MPRVLNGGLLKSTNGLATTLITGPSYRCFRAVNGYLAALRFASPNTTIDFLDLTDPKAPTVALSYTLTSFGSTTTDMYFYSGLNILVLTSNDANGNFAIIDTSSLPSSASHVTSSYNTINGGGSNYAGHRFHFDDGVTAYTSFTTVGVGMTLQSFDLSTLAAIDSSGVSTDRVKGRGVFLDDYLLVSNEDGFPIVYREDISNPAALVTDADIAWSGGTTTFGDQARILLSGSYLYVYQFSTTFATTGPSALHILDVSDPDTVPYPVVSATILTVTGQNARVPGIHKIGNLLYLPRKSTGNLKIVDVTIPALPSVKHDVWISNIFSFAAGMYNHIAYMAGHLYIPSANTTYVIVDTSVY